MVKRILDRVIKSVEWRYRWLLRVQKRYFRRFLVGLPCTGNLRRRYRIHPAPQFSSRYKIPVVMCTWRRIDRLGKTLRMLEMQNDVCIKLFIWNNNYMRADEIDRKLNSYSGIEVEVMHSIYNIGGFGRFYATRKICDQYPAVIFIDDDQDADDSAISQLWSGRDRFSICSSWAFNFNDENQYLNRSPVEPGEPATYCGTGGMICPTWVFEQDALFNDCPRKYWFIEDLWLSYFANHRIGLKLKKSSAEIWAEEDGKDQAGRLLPLKNEFLRELVAEGWELSPEPSMRRNVGTKRNPPGTTPPTE